MSGRLSILLLGQILWNTRISSWWPWRSQHMDSYPRCAERFSKSRSFVTIGFIIILSNDQNLGCVLYIVDCTTQLRGDYNQPICQYKDPYMNQPVLCNQMQKKCSSEWPIQWGFSKSGLFKGVGWSPRIQGSKGHSSNQKTIKGSIFRDYVLVGELVLLVGWKTITIKTSMFVVRFHFLCMGRRSCFQSLQSWEFVGIRYFPNSARTKKYGLESYQRDY